MNTEKDQSKDIKHDDHKPDPKLIIVSIDGREVKIKPGDYVVSNLKSILGVSPDYVLDQVRGGQLIPLNDGDTIKVHNHEEFISHVRCGTSS